MSGPCLRRLLAGVFMLAVAAGCRRPGLRDVNRDGTIVILCVGDSITQGNLYGAYAARLATLLAGRAEVFREGVTGEATAAGRKRLQEVLGRTAPDYVVILEGINDGCNVPGDVVVENLRAMAHAARARGAVPLLGTVFVSPDLRGASGGSAPIESMSRCVLWTSSASTSRPPWAIAGRS